MRADLSIRGESPSILINGRDVQQFSAGYALDSALMSMGAVDRIEVLRGPQSIMYGGRAIGGAINIITKKGDKNHPYAKVKALYGSGKELASSVLLSGGKENLSCFANVYGATKEEWNTPEGKIPYVEKDQQNLYARVDYDFLPEHVLSLEYMYNEASHKVGGKGYQHKKISDFYKKIWDTDPAKLHAAYISYEGELLDWLSLYATFGGGENDIDYTYGFNGSNSETPLDDYLSGQNNTSMKNDFSYGEIRCTMNFLTENRLRILSGIQYKSAKLDWSGSQFNIQETESYLSPYIQVEYKPIDYVLLMCGVRHDAYSYKKSNSKNSASPRFGVSLSPFVHTDYNWTTLWGSYSEAFNPPSAKDIQGSTQAKKGPMTIIVTPNPDLKPEKIKGMEFGIKQRLGRWATVEASYFDVNYEDMITSITKRIDSNININFINLNKSNKKGWEFMCEVYPFDWLILHFGYTDMEKKDKKTDKDLFLGRPNTIIQYGLTFANLHGFSGSIWGRQYNDYKNVPEHQKTIGKAQPSEGKIIWDMNILYKLNLKEGFSCEPFVAIHNLSNETYYAGGDVCNLMEERTYQAGISFKMDF